MLRATTTVRWLTKNVSAHRTNVHLTLTVSVKAINNHPFSTIWVALVKTRGPFDAFLVFFFADCSLGKLRNPEIAESGFLFVDGAENIDEEQDVDGVWDMDTHVVGAEGVTD